jgi:hypothetical protein
VLAVPTALGDSVAYRCVQAVAPRLGEPAADLELARVEHADDERGREAGRVERLVEKADGGAVAPGRELCRRPRDARPAQPAPARVRARCSTGTATRRAA